VTGPRLGLRENLPQFWLLVLLNAFVGAMVGLERTVLPLLGEQEFGLTSKTAITSFIVSFGVTKAVINLVAARLSDRIGRKPILVAGWLFALPVPFLIIYAPAWWWIDLANVLLGANQAMAWSMTVIMKIDLVGPKRRGLALGLNEFAGYFAVGAMAWVTGYVAGHYGLRPQPFYLGILISIMGLLMAVLVIRETRGHVALEAPSSPGTPTPRAPSFGRIFYVTSFGNLALFAACQAGLVNNLNDGMSWGLYPLFFAAYGLGARYNGRRVTLTDLDPAAIDGTERVMLSARANFVKYRDDGRLFDALTRAHPNHRIYRSCFAHTCAVTGQADATVEYGDPIWDFAATRILVEEAGGKFSVVRTWNVPSLGWVYGSVFGKPTLVDRLLKHFKKER